MPMVNSCIQATASMQSWGQCLIDTMFLGNPALAVIFFYAIAGIIVYKSRIPGTLILPIGSLFSLGLYLMSPNPTILIYLSLSVVLTAGWMGYVLIKKFHGE